MLYKLHSLINLSLLPVDTIFSYLQIAMRYTKSVWPYTVFIYFFFLKFHILAVQSSLPETKSLELLVIDISLISSVCP